MMERYPSGAALNPGFGGGTAHCEFEALTGFSVAFCGGVSPYENGLGRMVTMPSLARALARQGYQSAALHPYYKSMYNRPSAYRAMGFDVFIDQFRMKHTAKIGLYISDRSAYAETLDMLRQSDRPMFIHLVTMQNHGGYKEGRFDGDITAQGVAGKARIAVETLARGLSITDKATAAFFDELDKLAQDSVVVFWGDHLPMGWPLGVGRQRYEAPFFIRANFPLDNERLGIYSPLFFQPILSRLTGSRQTPFVAQLAALEREVHGIHLECSMDELSPRAKKLLDELYVIQYDVLMGEGYSDAMGFFDNEQ
jgi:hypothetical protein